MAFKEYEIEPNTLYGVDSGEYIRYQRGDESLFVSLHTTSYTPESDWVDDRHGYYPVTQYTTHLEIYKVKETENAAQRLANKIRKKFGKEPQKTKVREDIYKYECGGNQSQFIEQADRMEYAHQPEIKKIVDRACEQIMQQGRPLHEQEKQKIEEERRQKHLEALKKEDQEKIAKKKVEEAIVSRTVNDFFDKK